MREKAFATTCASTKEPLAAFVSLTPTAASVARPAAPDLPLTVSFHHIVLHVIKNKFYMSFVSDAVVIECYIWIVINTMV